MRKRRIKGEGKRSISEEKGDIKERRREKMGGEADIKEGECSIRKKKKKRRRKRRRRKKKSNKGDRIRTRIKRNKGDMIKRNKNKKEIQ